MIFYLYYKKKQQQYLNILGGSVTKQCWRLKPWFFMRFYNIAADHLWNGVGVWTPEFLNVITTFWHHGHRKGYTDCNENFPRRTSNHFATLHQFPHLFSTTKTDHWNFPCLLSLPLIHQCKFQLPRKWSNTHAYNTLLSHNPTVIILLITLR